MKRSVSEFKEGFIARTKHARERRGLSQKQIGQALGVAQDTYKNYETIRELPHKYIPAFCMVCGVSADWLFDIEGTAREQIRPGHKRVR